jgi:hypothetical protein
MEEMTGESLSALDAWAKFRTLPKLTQERFLRQVYMQELREAGIDQNEPGAGGLPRNGGYNRGNAAIDTLFPGEDWKGDVTIGNALFRTVAGGSIEVLTLGGALQVAALGTAVDPGYGLVALGQGDIAQQCDREPLAHPNLRWRRRDHLVDAGRHRRRARRQDGACAVGA